MKNKFAIVESITGGLISAIVTSIPDASSFFEGALIAYDNKVKEKIGINTQNGVVNAQTAKEMALKGQIFFNVKYCIALTGNAGPKTLENKPIGLVYIAINNKVYEKHFKGTRQIIQKQAAKFAINKIKEINSDFKQFLSILK